MSEQHKPSATTDVTPDPTSHFVKQVEQAGPGPLAWLEFLSDFNSEVLSFLATRVKEDVRTQHSILHCKDPAEMRQIQADFLQKSIDQYTEETGKLVELGNAAITQAQAKKPL